MSKHEPDRRSQTGDEQVVAVYIGRDCIGEIVPKPSGQFEAVITNGQQLGLYTTAAAASRAIWLAMHDRETML